MTTKQALQELLARLPDDASLEDVQYHLFVLQKIRSGERALDDGRVIPHQDVMRDLATWLK